MLRRLIPLLSAVVLVACDRAPVATPYVSNVPDYMSRPELGPSKMGIYVARPNSEAIMQFVRAAIRLSITGKARTSRTHSCHVWPNTEP